MINCPAMTPAALIPTDWSFLSLLSLLSKARDDEQHIVDANGEPDHGDDLYNELVKVHHPTDRCAQRNRNDDRRDGEKNR